MRKFMLLLFVVVICGVAVSAEAQEKRYALLIGNQAYDPAVGVLKNPHNDIAMVGAALAKHGFEVLAPVKDARRSTILGAVRDLTNRLRTAGPGAVGSSTIPVTAQRKKTRASITSFQSTPGTWVPLRTGTRA